MFKVYELFPQKFIVKGQKNVHRAQKALSLNTSKPQFLIDPIIAGTWLDPPKQFDSDIGTWPENTVFPKGTNPYPKDMPNRPPARPAEFSIVDPNLKRLLLAPKLKEAKLNTSVFKNPSAVKLAGTAFVTSDYFPSLTLIIQTNC